MNGRASKKTRKVVNKKVRYDLTEVAKQICEASWYTRVVYAFKIIFKFRIGESLKVKRG